MVKKYNENDSKINEHKSFKDVHAYCDRYKLRKNKLKKLKAMYGKSYDPHWDKGQRSQIMPRAEAYDGDYEQLYDGYFEEESGNYFNCII